MFLKGIIYTDWVRGIEGLVAGDIGDRALVVDIVFIGFACVAQRTIHSVRCLPAAALSRFAEKVPKEAT